MVVLVVVLVFSVPIFRFIDVNFSHVLMFLGSVKNLTVSNFLL